MHSQEHGVKDGALVVVEGQRRQTMRLQKLKDCSYTVIAITKG